MRLLVLSLITLFVSADASTVTPSPSAPGILVDIGDGQRLHLNCAGSGAPVVVFESGAGDFSVIWSLVLPGVSRFTRACSYDRAGYAWSDPGARPRTFNQLALELRTLLEKAGVAGPYVLVGQSFGGSLVRGFAARYPSDVAGMVLVDAIHEDGYVTYGGQAHHLREESRGRVEPTPRIARDRSLERQAESQTPSAPMAIEAPLDRMPAVAREQWQWAATRPLYKLAQPLEMEWSPDEAERTWQLRRSEPRTMGDRPLVVLARTRGNYREGMNVPAARLEELRRAQQADLAGLSSRGTLRFAPDAGHNIHLEDPAFTVQAIHDVVDQVRGRR